MSGGRRSVISRAREEVAQLAVKKLGMSGTEVSRYLGVTISCINRSIANKEISLMGKKVMKVLDEIDEKS
jgi:hypothetical protein